MTTGPRPSRAVEGHIHGLDGVRGFAVLSVIAFHLWPRTFPGGFLGVDVFFVISGFLITTLLLRERDRNGHVDLPAFWLRRARRLLPALVVVVLTSVAAAWAVSSELLVDIDRQVVGAATFTTNWLEVLAGSDYFDESSPTLFVTFWSLAVEEQFYLLWPVAFGAVAAVVGSSRHRVRVATGIAVASAALMAILLDPGSNPTRVYYGTDTHLFGLMFGAALAFAFPGEVGVLGQRRWQRLRMWTGFVALGGLVVMVLTVDGASTSTYPWGIGLASVLSVVVIAALPGPGTAFTRLHRLRPLAWVGERSYGIYLWHWPVIVIVTAVVPATAPGAAPAPAVVVASLATTLVLAEASFRWVETPVRRDGFAASWAALRASLTAAGAGWAASMRGPIAVTSAAAVVVLAGVAIGTAPEKSAAQLAVERGEQAIASQRDLGAVTASARHARAQAGSPTTSTTTGALPGPAWPPESAVPPGELMTGFGDSVLSGAAPAIYERFPGIFLDAEPIRQWKDGPAVVRRAIEAGTLRPVVLLSFGTNAGLESAGSRQALRQVLDLLGESRRVVLVNVAGVSDWVPSSNAALEQISASYPNTIVADWHSRVAADPSLLHSDRTHPDFEGIEVYADLVAEALEELGPR